LQKIWDQKFEKQIVTPLRKKIKSNFNNSNLNYIKKFELKFISKHLNSILEIIINLIDFFGRFKININDITKVFLEVNFPPFCKHKKGHQHQQRTF
jgi:hypothetical protein